MGTARRVVLAIPPFEPSFRPARLAIFVVLLVAFPACKAEVPVAPALVDSDLVAGEPVRAATFLAAFARGDEATAEDVASPLYRAEWTRRGQVLAPTWLAFRFAGGVVDDAGFGHYLYLATMAECGHLQAVAPSVWRVDADRGRRRAKFRDSVWCAGCGQPVLDDAANRSLAATDRSRSKDATDDEQCRILRGCCPIGHARAGSLPHEGSAVPGRSSLGVHAL